MDIRERAVADLSKIDATILRLEEQLRRAREDRVKLEHFLEIIDRYGPERDEGAEPAKAAGRRPSKATRLRELAHAILSEERSPVPIGELAQRVIQRGGDIPGADKGSYLSAVLARDERFHNIRNAGWLLTGSAWATREMPHEPRPGPEATASPEAGAEPADAENSSGQPEGEPDFDHEPEWRPTPARRPQLAARPPVVDELDDDIPF